MTARTQLVAMGVTTVPILVTVGQASYIQLIGDLTFETWMAIVGLMLLFSFVAFLAALLITAPFSTMVLCADRSPTHESRLIRNMSLSDHRVTPVAEYRQIFAELYQLFTLFLRLEVLKSRG
jgi:hypothetical protein